MVFLGRGVLNINICFCNPQKAHLWAKIGPWALATSYYNLILNATVLVCCLSQPDHKLAMLVQITDTGQWSTILHNYSVPFYSDLPDTAV